MRYKSFFGFTGTADLGIGNRESEPTPNPSQEGNGNRESGIGKIEKILCN
ncbi:hypothetical protein [Moorena sp. SIO4A5]|nr:hypothetical protein [Moorena sp. SIO4A5]NEO21928.1 hypothetical protein [Moorena sp. SIO4A5]